MVNWRCRPRIATLCCLPGFLILAATIHPSKAQDASKAESRRADQKSNYPATGDGLESPKDSRAPILLLKPATRLAAAPARNQGKPPTPSKVRGQAEPTIALPSGDLDKLTAQDLAALIAGQRELIKIAPADDIARRNLGLLSVEAAIRILKSESLGRAREASDYATLIKTSLMDTLWRVTRLVGEQPARAQAALGMFYAEGILAPADIARSCDYFAKSAAAGQIDAAYRASQCEAKTDPKRAQQWLEQAAIGGNAAAEERMGRACIERGNYDPVCAKPWLQSAAAQGRASATSLLAWIYIREGTSESLSQALRLYQSAAEAGDFTAQNNLGELFETGRGVEKQPALAFGWYRRSAEGGFAPGQFNLARLLAYGFGTERDPNAAREWAARAQKQGIAQAAELLKLIAEAEKAH